MIDFAALARQFQAPLTAQTTLMVPVFARLARAMERLARQADQLERATRAYPVLRYRGDAVGVRLHLAPDARLVPVDAGLGLGEGLRTGGTRFVAGLRLAAVSVEQDMALPRLVWTADEALAVIEASLERHRRPTAGMFDPRSVRFSDVFGIANLAWSSLLGAENQRQLRGAAEGVVAVRSLFTVFGTSSQPASEGSAEAETGGGSLADLVRLPAEGLMVLPLVVPLADALISDGVLAAQRRLLVELSTGVEPPLRELRSGVVDAWLTAYDVGTTVHFTLSAAELVIAVNRLLLEHGFPVWFEGILNGITEFGRGVTIWGSFSRAVVIAFQLATDDLMHVDLIPWIAANLLPSWLASQFPCRR